MVVEIDLEEEGEEVQYRPGPSCCHLFWVSSVSVSRVLSAVSAATDHHKHRKINKIRKIELNIMRILFE